MKHLITVEEGPEGAQFEADYREWDGFVRADQDIEERFVRLGNLLDELLEGRDLPKVSEGLAALEVWAGDGVRLNRLAPRGQPRSCSVRRLSFHIRRPSAEQKVKIGFTFLLTGFDGVFRRRRGPTAEAARGRRGFVLADERLGISLRELHRRERRLWARSEGRRLTVLGSAS